MNNKTGRNPLKNNIKEYKLISFNWDCYETYPCQHDVTYTEYVTNDSSKCITETLSARTILQMFQKDLEKEENQAFKKHLMF
jgi:hypothetical protein